MVAMSQHPGASIRDDKERLALEAIEELIAELGVRGAVALCLKSSAGGQFERLGGNATLRVIQVILRQIVHSENPPLEAEIMALGSGVLLESKQSMRTIAAKHGLGVAAISKRTIAFCEKWDLPPSEFMRPLKDRKIYSLSNRPRET